MRENRKKNISSIAGLCQLPNYYITHFEELITNSIYSHIRRHHVIQSNFFFASINVVSERSDLHKIVLYYWMLPSIDQHQRFTVRRWISSERKLMFFIFNNLYRPKVLSLTLKKCEIERRKVIWLSSYEVTCKIRYTHRYIAREQTPR